MGSAGSNRYATIDQLYDDYRASTGVSCDFAAVRSGHLFIAFHRHRPHWPPARGAWNFLERVAPGFLHSALGLAGRLRLSTWLPESPGREGNLMAADALERGATRAVVDQSHFCRGAPYRLVPDTREALIALAGLHRARLKGPVVGITGSNGKTTTTRLVQRVLGSTFKTAGTVENSNNIPGVPISLLSMQPDTEIGLLELGITRAGQLEGLCAMARPTCGLITNIGPAHLRHLRSIDGVQAAKGELFHYLRRNDGTLFVNLNDRRVVGLAGDHPRVVTYGSDTAADVRGEVVAAEPWLRVRWHIRGPDGAPPPRPLDIQTRLAGRHNLDNVLAAIAVGVHFGVPSGDIVTALEECEPPWYRSQILRQGSVTILMDAWNANPASVCAALAQLAERAEPRRVAILGEMLDLGRAGDDAHREVLRRLRRLNLTEVLLVGRGFARVRDRSFGDYCASIHDARHWLKARRFDDACVLLKGSRRLQLELLVPAIASGDGA